MSDRTTAFATTNELEMLRDSARGFLAQKWPVDRAVGASLDKHELRRIWREIAGQGWLATGLADLGGMRGGAILLEELGRAACPVPLIDCLLANLLLADGAVSGETRELVERLHDGTAAVSCALGPLDGDAGAGEFEVSGDGAATRLSGRAAFVEGTAVATHLLVVTGRSQEIAILAPDVAGVTITPTPGFGVPPLAEIAFAQAPARITSSGLRDFAAIAALARIALAARALGAARRGFDMIVDYAKERTQFGKKIGQYQAIQHKLANALINLDISRLSLLRAAAAFDTGDPGWSYAASVAFAIASPALRQVCLETHHAFGGVSFWEEHEMPRHFRRIHADLVRCGGVHAAREAIAAALLGR